MRSLLMGAALAGALAVVGCDADDVTGPGASMEASAYGADRADAAEAGRLVFMTWNVFVGASIEDAVNVEPSEIPFAAAAVWAEIQASDFAGRAASIAAQVAKYRPHFLALNEVTTFWSQTPSDFDVDTFDPGAPATTVALDFEAILLAALADRGLEYVVAVRADNFQAELPVYDESSPNYLTDLRLQDHDLLLVRSDVAVSASTTQNFAAYPTLFGIPQLRSLSYVDAAVDGTSLRVAVTHLEPADTSLVVVPELEYVQRLQGTEVRNVLGAGPVVVMGDFNSDAYGASTRTYDDFRAAGYGDAYDQGGGGWTCCQDTGIATWPSILDRRVDLILYRGDFELSTPEQAAFQALTVGNKRSDWTSSGLWPSDHAGVVATLDLRPGS